VHRERWRSTNLLERSLGEVKRRTKVIGRFPAETSCLTLVWALLDLFFSHASNGATSPISTETGRAPGDCVHARPVASSGLDGTPVRGAVIEQHSGGGRVV
jgi:hypothetical protein